ncbi:hypothetical protein C3B55_00762 [Candidatus Pseudomonas adelgestsugas]|uniref:Uncharacterized protein n=1 Tax=Candidatus Pseudomonas adelgestsugas TaxID=1302376 RepID=A0ABX5R9H9_9PSED|nr:hypothetical protein C3B55_00762 [Candidatus Pseudomonas adelgestsugas]
MVSNNFGFVQFLEPELAVTSLLLECKLQMLALALLYFVSADI